MMRCFWATSSRMFASWIILYIKAYVCLWYVPKRLFFKGGEFIKKCRWTKNLRFIFIKIMTYYFSQLEDQIYNEQKHLGTCFEHEFKLF